MAKDSPVAAVAAGLLIFILGLSIGVWGLGQWRTEQERLEITARAEGAVTGHLNGHPMVSFALPSGDRVSFTATSVSGDEFPVGRNVSVLYRMDLPSEAVIDRPGARRTRHGLVAAGALVLMAFGGYLAWYARNYDLRRAGSG